MITDKGNKVKTRTMADECNDKSEKMLIKIEPNDVNKCDGECGSEVSVKLETEDGDDGLRAVNQRENRLTNIIDQLRCQSKLKGKALISVYIFSYSSVVSLVDNYK